MNLEFKKNNKKYWEFIRLLRSDKRVQSGFVEQVKITRKEQEVYMNKYNNNYYVCLCDDIPSGYIGEIDGNIRLCTAPEYQGKGIGSFMIREITKIQPNIFAKIKLDNWSSLKAFEKAGYVKKYYLLEPKK
jgi:GNAT superfamily N-acetyltransferase|tara:strand:+ start:157 stop:549 length:393 start_codon:yes stop_codon:yes gene_type:complete